MHSNFVMFLKQNIFFLLPGSLSRNDTKNKCILEDWLVDCYITSNEFHSHIYIILDNEMLKL